jgi:hypothetical protein
MIGSKTKEFSFGKIIKQKDLKSLNDFIISEYSNVKYSIHTKNNIIFELESFNELIKYENYTESKITWIKVDANKDMDNKYLIYPDLRLFIGEYKTEYEIKKSSEKDILCISDKIDKLINNFKSPHNWMLTFWGSCIINTIFLSPLIFSTSKILKWIETFLEAPWNYMLFYVAIFAMGEVFALIRMYLYPRNCFLIGEQIKKYKTKKQIRNTLVTIIVGVITTFFSNFIFNLI